MLYIIPPVTYDSKSKSLFVTYVPQKGIDEHKVAVAHFLDAIQELGYTNSPIRIRNDQEPSALKVINTIIEQRAAQTVLEESPRASSQSNGAAEIGVQHAQGHVRALHRALEDSYKCKIPINHNTIPWLCMHAGFCHNRFQLGHDGHTPYRRIKGRDFDKPLCEFGECVHFKFSAADKKPDLKQIRR